MSAAIVDRTFGGFEDEFQASRNYFQFNASSFGNVDQKPSLKASKLVV